MANPTRSQLKAGAIQIRDETAQSANTATRVGSALLGDIASGLFEYDPNDTYQPGEYCIFQGVLAKAKTTVGKNESPATAAIKWDLRVAKTADDIALNDYRPVSSNAVAELISQPGSPAPAVPNATTTTKGKVRLATDAEYEAGVASDIVPSVKQVHDQLAAIGLELGEFQPTLDALITDAAAQFVGSLPAVPGSDATAPENNLLGFGLLYKKPDGSLGIKRMLGNDAWAYLARQATESELQFFARTKVRPFLSVSALLRDNPFVDQTPYLTGRDANLFFHKYKSEGDWTDRGLVFLEQDGTQNLFRSIIGFTGLYNFFQIDGVRQLKAYYDRVLVEVDLKAKGNVLAQSFSTSSIPIAETKPDYLPVGMRQTDGTMAIQYIPFAPFQSVLNAQAVSYGQVKQVYCQNVPIPTPVVTRWQRLTPAMLGSPIAHPLETAGANVIVSMRGIDNRPEDILIYNFPDAGHIRFTLPDGVSDYPGGSYKLETIQS